MATNTGAVRSKAGAASGRKITREAYREIQKALSAKKGNKYGARKEIVDNITFDSKREAKRYRELKLLEKSGTISHIKVHPPYPLYGWAIPGCETDDWREKVGIYEGDFEYILVETGKIVVEDVKVGATRTALYRLKVKILLANDPFIDFREV